MRPRLILNADDFGWDGDTVAATISAFERGLLTSATIMANTSASDDAIAWAREHPEFGFGVHLVWVGDGPERPLSPPGEVRSLVGSGGAFRGSTSMRVRGALGVVPGREIVAEAMRQIEYVRDAGISISHVDAHGHLHKYGSFRRALTRLLPSLGIHRVRTAQDLYLRPPRTSPTVWLGGHWRRRLRAAFDTTDHLYMPGSDGGTHWETELVEPLERLAGLVEIGVHPGKAEPWRADELARLERFVKRARARGMELVDWRAV